MKNVGFLVRLPELTKTGEKHGQRKRFSESRKEKIRKIAERKAQRKKREEIQKEYDLAL
jgi:hypothetical protein